MAIPARLHVDCVIGLWLCVGSGQSGTSNSPAAPESAIEGLVDLTNDEPSAHQPASSLRHYTELEELPGEQRFWKLLAQLAREFRSIY